MPESSEPAETAHAVKFPGWRYHPSEPDGRIFQTAAEVPDGWVDHPNKFPGGSEAVEVKPAAPTKPLTKAEKKALELAEAAAKGNAYRDALYNGAKAKFGDGVPPNATIEELESALDEKFVADTKAAHGVGI